MCIGQMVQRTEREREKAMIERFASLYLICRGVYIVATISLQRRRGSAAKALIEINLIK